MENPAIHLPVFKKGAKMSDIVNIIVNNGVAVGIVIYFLYKDYKWNDELLKTLTSIQVTLTDMWKELKTNEHTKGEELN